MTLPPSAPYSSPSDFLTLTPRTRPQPSVRSLTDYPLHHGTVLLFSNLGEEGFDCSVPSAFWKQRNAGLYETRGRSSRLLRISFGVRYPAGYCFQISALNTPAQPA
jgi:hypothetical protein